MAKSRAFGLNFLAGESGLKTLYQPGSIPGPVDALILMGIVQTLQIKHYTPYVRAANGFSGKYFQLNLEVEPGNSVEVARIALESATDLRYVDAYLYLSNTPAFALNKNQKITCRIQGDSVNALEEFETLSVYGFSIEPE